MDKPNFPVVGRNSRPNRIALLFSAILIASLILLMGKSKIDAHAIYRIEAFQEILQFIPIVFREEKNIPTPTISPTIPPTITPTPTSTPPVGPEWLTYLNNLRALGNLPSVSENQEWSLGCIYHSRYMVKNDVIQHDEDPSNPWYTPEGLAAAQNSNLTVASYTGRSDFDAVDSWLTGPFHGIGILDPALVISAYGSYREEDGGWEMGGCLDVLRGLGTISPSISFPIRWPEDGATMPYDTYNGGESPDPLSSCNGYSIPSGPPIYFQIGSGNQVPNVTSHSFQLGASVLESCVFDETSYINPNPSYQSLGRSVLNARDAIIIIPRYPLTPSTTYSVSITVNGQVYNWSFTTSGSSSPDAPQEAQTIIR